MILKSYSKINLYLSIGKKLSNNYHEITSVLHQINLCDSINIKRIKKGEMLNNIIIKSNLKNLENKKNLAYKAAAFLIKKKCNPYEGIEIYLEKKIPTLAGLGGGSSNAAIALIGLNKLCNLNLSKKELLNLSSKIGSDVPFFIKGGTCIIKGTGDIIQKINVKISLYLLIIKPEIGINTAWAYKNLDEWRAKNKQSEDFKSKQEKKNKLKNLLNALKSKNVEKVAENMHNDFEEMMIKMFPVIGEIKNDLISNGAINAQMSGSGSGVFGIFKTKNKAKIAFLNLKSIYHNVFLSNSL